MAKMTEDKYTIADFFEKTPDLVCIADKDGYFKNVNQSVVSKLGYNKEELLAHPILEFVHPNDREFTSRKRKDLISGKVLVNFENRYLTKNGNTVWLSWTSIYFLETETVFAIAKDISETKKIEFEVESKYRKYKSLARRFKKSIEKDRKFLALELHEELAQLASVVKMDVDWIKLNHVDLPEKSQNRIHHAAAMADLLITTIRRISFSISPSMLEDIGLAATIHWHCKEFSILNGIPCHFNTDIVEQSLSQEIKTDIFRICQESLSNVMYHAEASEVNIRLSEDDNDIHLSIADNGKGFEIQKIIQQNGLNSIRERVDSINGKFRIDSAPGKGTQIQVSIHKPA